MHPVRTRKGLAAFTSADIKQPYNKRVAVHTKATLVSFLMKYIPWPAFFVAAWTAFISTLIALPWEKEVRYGFERKDLILEHAQELDTPIYQRTTIYFTSHGVRCEAWFYMPKPLVTGGTIPPVVLMAHGLGSQKDMGLHPYAEHFAHGGIAVLVFDYRGFGGSDGVPRHVVNYRRYLEDWEAALQFVRTGGLGDTVDASRIGLWGVSYAGGHALMMAARHPDLISCVVANEPFLTTRGQVSKNLNERGPVRMLRAFAVAFNDQLRALMGLPRAYLQLVGAPGELAILQLTEEEISQIQRPAPPRQGGWQGWAAGNFLLTAIFYQPLNHIHKIRCPVLLVAGTKDHICTPHLIHEAANKMSPGLTTVLEVPYNHIEAHKKMSETENLKPVIEFLQQHLKVEAAWVVPEAAAEKAAEGGEEAESEFG